jgi:hypothetical protein
MPSPIRNFTTESFSFPLLVFDMLDTMPRKMSQATAASVSLKQHLFGNGVKLHPGQAVEYITTDSQSDVPNIRQKYAAMLRAAFERSNSLPTASVHFLIPVIVGSRKI